MSEHHHLNEKSPACVPEGAVPASRGVMVVKSNSRKQIVYGEVYAPLTMDSQGEFMRAEDIELMAYRFLIHIGTSKGIDTNHDNLPNGSFVVESFIARKGDPDFTEGAWVIGVHIPDAQVWAEVEAGRLNGFSFQSLVRSVATEVEVVSFPQQVGLTASEQDHEHMFVMEVDGFGRVARGWTSEVNGHTHEIRYGTVTVPAADGHTHRLPLRGEDDNA
jgi:hypothetical protein